MGAKAPIVKGTAMKQVTLQEIKDIQYPLIVVPFNGRMISVTLREITQAQAYSCGGTDMSLIETFQDKIRMKKKPSLREIYDYSLMMHKIAKISLVSPTYDEIFDICGSGKEKIDAIHAEIEEVVKLIASLPNGPKKTELENDLVVKRISMNLVLPDDFLSYITSYALGVDKSDIKLVTDEYLYNASISAKLGHDNPSDHFEGNLNAFQKEDFNRRAWMTYAERKKDNK